MIYSLKKLGLFVFFSSVLLVACKRPDEDPGESLQPEEDRFSALQTDTTTIYAYTERVDSVRTDIFSNILAGNYIDEEFGAVRCKGVMQFVPSSDYEELPESYTVQSVVLSLAYQGEAYGKNVPLYFNVNQLEETLYIDSNYYSNREPIHDNTNLILPGQESQSTNPEEVEYLSEGETEYLNLELKDSFGAFLLEQDSVFDDDAAFREIFQGLVISSQTMDGRVLSFSTINSKITVRYGYEMDKKVYFKSMEFVVTSSCESYTRVQHQRFGSPLANLGFTEQVPGNQLCYLQSSGGTKIKIDLSQARWLQFNPGVTINKAEIILPYDASSKYAPVDSLTLVYEYEPDLFKTTKDVLYDGGNVQKTTGLYRFNITRHLQAIVDGEIDQGEVVILANPRIGGAYNAMGVRRTLIAGPEKEPDNPANNMRLVVTYTY